MNIKTSNIMNQISGDYENENTLIRVPRLLRETLNLVIGQDLAFTSVNGNPVLLKVFPAYKEDAITDDAYCYVTHNTFTLINTALSNLQTKPITSITLGCDPELFLVDNKTNTLLRANAFFKKWGEVGHDGILAEIRPKPALQPKILTNNIYELIKKIRTLLELNTANYNPDRITLYGASSFKTALKQPFMGSAPIYTTAGFHLHFGLPPSILGMSPETACLMHKITNIMDYYVGIPSVLLEQTLDYNRRSNTSVSYGKPGDYRLDDRTFEYRVPGGSLLRHPILTEGLLTLGNVVINDFVNKIKEATNNFNNISVDNITLIMQQGLSLYTNIPSLHEAFSIICSPTLNEARSRLGTIFKNLSNMNNFGENSRILNTFFSLIDNSNHINNNIEDNWRSYYEHELNVRGSSHAYKTYSTTGCLLETQPI